ncbi:9838_t:CDS:1, partial [Racocetra fulgida]
NHWEYNEWCKAGLLLDKALFTGDANYVQLARQVALERAYVVRVADEDGWSVAVKMTSGDMSNPILELFSGKRERARMAVQQFPRNKRSKVSYGQGYYLNNQLQPVQVQVPSLYMPSGIQPQPFVHPNWQQISSQRMFCPPPTNNYWDETHSRDLSGSSLGQQPFHNSWSPNP